MHSWGRMISAKQAGSVLDFLDQAGFSGPHSLAELDPATFQDLLRQEGLKVSAKDLAPFLRLMRWLDTKLELVEDADEFLNGSYRDELLNIPGVGPSTADDLLLRALRQPRYPLDRATYRILMRHGWIDGTADYDETVELLIRNSDEDPNLLADLSVWFEETGRSFCRAGGPKCERCPLRPLLPEGGPMEGDP